MSRRPTAIGFGLTLLSVLLVTASSVGAAEPVSDGSDSPETMLRSFYHWYVKETLLNHSPLTEDKKEMRRFVSERLLREIDHMAQGPDGLDGDYFLDAQDFDEAWANHITVSAPQVKGERGSAVVSLQGAQMSRKLQIDFVREKSGWKIDKVTGQ